MGAVANTEATEILKGRFGSSAAAAKPSAWYLALSSSTPSRNVGTGVIENVTELSTSGTGYAREALSNEDGTWTVSGRTATAGPITWTAEADITSGPTHWVLYDASVNGTARYFGSLSGSVSWLDGATITITSVSVPVTDV